MVFLTDLDEVLRERGVPVIETPGWKTRGYAGWSFRAVRGTLWHHTATHRSAFTRNPAPTLNMCINGRAGLPGPLCQLVLGRNGKTYIVAAGWGNHAGRGYYPGIPRDMGNAYLIGVEMESSGIAPADWTDEQLEAIPVLRDALRDGYRHKLDIAHAEYSSTGKIDPWGLPGGMDWLRNGTRISTASITEESTLSSAEVNELKDHIDAKFWDILTYKGRHPDPEKAAEGELDPRDFYSYTRYPGDSIMGHQIKAHDGKFYALETFERVNNARILETLRNSEKLLAQNEALTAAVKALAGAQGVDTAPIVAAIEAAAQRAEARIDAAVDSAMDDVEFTITATPKDPDPAE